MAVRLCSKHWDLKVSERPGVKWSDEAARRLSQEQIQSVGPFAVTKLLLHAELCRHSGGEESRVPAQSSPVPLRGGRQ